MRIVGGDRRGAPLAGPRSDAIRPTSDRTREAVFNVLAHALGDPVPGARVLDLFAGTGALGLEAMSRGAAYCLFVEVAADARGLIRRNIETLGFGGRTRVFRRDATRLGPAHPMQPFTLAFLDPPYGLGLGERALAAADAGGWLAPGALIVFEETARTDITVPEAFEALDERAYGDTKVLFLRHRGAAPAT